MPRPKRFFPVSQSLNHDPEVRELRAMFEQPPHRCGAEMVLVWLEILARTDSTDGELKGTRDEIVSSLQSVASKASAKRLDVARVRSGVSLALSWMVSRGWLIDPGENRNVLIVANHWKYHQDRADKRRQRAEPGRTSPTLRTGPDRTEPKIKIKGPNVRPTGADSEGTETRPGLEVLGSYLEKWRSREPEGDQAGNGAIPPKQTSSAASQNNPSDLADPSDPIPGDSMGPSDQDDPPAPPPDPNDPYGTLRGCRTAEEFEARAREFLETAESYGMDVGRMGEDVDEIRQEEWR